VGVEFGEQMLEITFDPQTREFVCLTEDRRREIRLSSQGLTQSVLMGELDCLTTGSPYQPALPFSRPDLPRDDPFQYLDRLDFETFTGTSL
jgi:hypothetical protein